MKEEAVILFFFRVIRNIFLVDISRKNAVIRLSKTVGGTLG